jgi:hypothetical protein
LAALLSRLVRNGCHSITSHSLKTMKMGIVHGDWGWLVNMLLAVGGLASCLVTITATH